MCRRVFTKGFTQQPGVDFGQRGLLMGSRIKKNSRFSFFSPDFVAFSSLDCKEEDNPKTVLF
jgi:hypothetical protein